MWTRTILLINLTLCSLKCLKLPFNTFNQIHAYSVKYVSFNRCFMATV